MALAQKTMMSPAALELGMGDSLRQQLADQEEERKKKMLQQAQAMQRGNMSPGAQMLFPSGHGA